MLTDPRRILDVRRHLHLGAQEMHFDHRRGALAPGRVLQLQATSATVQDTATYTRWKLPYVAIVADPTQRAEQAPPMRPRPVDVATFKLGDTVSFTDKHLSERIGTVTRINAKSCSLLCDGEQWRVSPGLLRKIIDLQMGRRGRVPLTPTSSPTVLADMVLAPTSNCPSIEKSLTQSPGSRASVNAGPKSISSEATGGWHIGLLSVGATSLMRLHDLSRQLNNDFLWLSAV